MNLTDLACHLYVGTDDGVRILSIVEGEVTVVREGVTGNAVRDIAVGPTDPETAYIGCGLGGWGLYRTTGGGQQFTEVGFADEWVWGVTYAPDGTLYVGTEPPMLYQQTADGFVPLDGMRSSLRLRCRGLLSRSISFTATFKERNFRDSPCCGLPSFA